MKRSQVTKGLQLKLARVQQGLHLYQLARQVGISTARLSQYEGEHREIPPRLEAKLHTLLGLRKWRGHGEAE
ncbi:helix-turn-helix domain-containing protein [Chloroflexota bacterium]